MSFKVTQSNYTSPILIVDREGTIGVPLVQEIAKSQLVMLVSSHSLNEINNVILVPFRKKIPQIPDNTFSHIFIVYRGEKELLKALPSFIRKAREGGGRLVFITDLFNYKEGLLKGLEKQYEKVDILVLGDIFSPTLENGSPINHLLSTAKAHGRLRLFNSGLDLLHPVALSDVVEGIIACVFRTSDGSQEYLLYPPHPVTELSVARDLQKKYPLLQIDFTQQKRQAVRYKLPTSGTHLFSNSYPLAQRLSEIDLSHTKLAQSTQVLISKPAFSPVKFPRLQKIFLPALIILFIVLLPILTSIGLAFAGGVYLLRAQDELAGKGLQAASLSAKTSNDLFLLADASVGIISAALGVAGVEKGVVGFQDTIHTGSQMSQAFYDGLNAGLLLQKVFKGEENDPKKAFLVASDKLKSSFTIIQGLQAENKLPSQVAGKLDTYQKSITFVLNTLETYPKLLGFDGKKKYIILFQNNAELRAGGGFIGSFALVNLDKAKLSGIKIYDVYDADGQLKTPLDPPFEFARYLGSTNLFMRDSNYSIDFPTGASEVARMLNLEIGEKVDGVISIDNTFLSELIGITGSLTVPDYNEVLTKDNFYTKTQAYAQKDFFPGSTKKKDFLRSVQESLMAKFENGGIPEQKLLLLATKMTEEKHLLFAFPESSVQKLFTLNNASSSIVERRKAVDSSYLDFIGLSEENLGENKANRFLKRTLEQKVSIDGEGTVTERFDVTYKNISEAKTEYGGDYEAYVRLITPLDTALKEVLVDNITQQIVPTVTNPRVFVARSFRAPAGLEVEERVESGRKVYGVYLVVPKSSSKKLSFAYTLSQKAPVDLSVFDFNLLIFKQPGTLQDPYKLTLSYPMAIKLFKSNQSVNDVGGKILGETVLNTDKEYIFTFSKR
ncbi:MAG: DUF4012 domain-containing protein [Candidatus Levybacteria bacterium]|nr:DUF4012 domain-containing protein [Candidatus Levybacteria bacterium]